MYSIIHSIYLLSLHPSNRIKINDKIMKYITTYILPVFNNYKELIYYTKNDQNITRKKLLYTKNVIKTSNKIEKINQDIMRHKATLLIILISISIISCFILLSNLSNNEKGFIFSIMIYVLFAIYIMIYFYLSLKPKIEEQFQNTILYPRFKANTNNYCYNDGVIVRIESSNNSVDAFKVFDNNQLTSFNIDNSYDRIPKQTYRSNYAGEYIKIDLGEYILVNRYVIKGNMKAFRIYGSNDNMAWSNVNHNSWVILDNVQDKKSDQFQIGNTIVYRYIMIIVNQLISGTSLNINSFELYGNKVKRNITLKSSFIHINNTTNEWITQKLPDIILPTDYDDIGLISWDLNINAYKKDGIDTFYGCVWTNLISVCLPSVGPDKFLYGSIKGTKTSLKNSKVSAIIELWNRQNLQNLNYFPKKKKNRIILNLCYGPQSHHLSLK